MNGSAFSAFLVAAAVAGILNNASGQTINATVQTTSPRVVTGRSAPAAKPAPAARPGPQAVPRATGVNPQRFNSNMPRAIAQPPMNVQGSYLPPLQTSNPAFAALNVPRNGQVQQMISVDPATRQTELRTLGAIRQRGVVTREGDILDPATRQNEIHTLATMREHRTLGTNNQILASIDPQRHIKNRDPETGPPQDKPDGPKDGHGKKWHNKKDHVSFDDASRRHWHEWHDRNWWHDHCQTIIFVNTGYYFLDGSYWYPAYGYDPLQTYYDYDGPVYTYSNLLPDEVIANVQTALQSAGYYYGPITGSLSVDTRAAIANFQRDYGLQTTGAIDEDTVEALGLY